LWAAIFFCSTFKSSSKPSGVLLRTGAFYQQ